LDFIGCNLNPDPSGGSCNPNFHATGAHYINGDTTAFMQLITADLFKDFPTLKFIIPHGGGAVSDRFRVTAKGQRPLWRKIATGWSWPTAARAHTRRGHSKITGNCD
jgi:4-oxalmesaconate hydratase